MNIFVINGSPSGNDSGTLRYVRYLEKTHPECKAIVENAAARLHSYEIQADGKPSGKLQALVDQATASDLIIWSFPVYIYLVPYPLKRLLELIQEQYPDALVGKYTMMLSTSIHFFDTVAHDYMHEVADDLRMKYLGAWSAAGPDLLEEEKRKSFDLFFEEVLQAVREQMPTQRMNAPIHKNTFVYKPVSQPALPKKPQTSQAQPALPKKTQTPQMQASPVPEPHRVPLSGRKVLILSDEREGDNLSFMTARLRKCFDGEVEQINLHQIRINGGCIGCFHCTFDHQCIYGDKDDIRHIYNEVIPAADIVIYAGNIVDRFLSSRWKLFMDRRFMNNHTPFLPGKQLGVVLSGSFGSCPTLHTFLRAEAQVNDGNLAGIVTDEVSSSAELDALLDHFCADIAAKAAAGYRQPLSFEGIGGRKIFRDAMYGNMRFVFRADHAYYKTHGWYDFPQNDRKMMTKNRIAIALTGSEKAKAVIRKQMRKKMLEPYDNFLETL